MEESVVSKKGAPLGAPNLLLKNRQYYVRLPMGVLMALKALEGVLKDPRKMTAKDKKRFDRLFEKVQRDMRNEPKRRALQEKKEERIRVKKWEQRFLRDAKKAGFSETQAKFLLKQNRRFAPVNHGYPPAWDGHVGPERF